MSSCEFHLLNKERFDKWINYSLGISFSKTAVLELGRHWWLVSTQTGSS